MNGEYNKVWQFGVNWVHFLGNEESFLTPPNDIAAFLSWRSSRCWSQWPDDAGHPQDVSRMAVNHAVSGDVTLGHYVGKSEAQLRAGWQTVADFIDAAATPAKPQATLRRDIRQRPRGLFRRRVQSAISPAATVPVLA